MTLEIVPALADSREQILAISIYCESSDIGEKSFGKCAKVYPGKPPLREILQAEVAGEHIEKKPVDNIHWDTNVSINARDGEEGEEWSTHGSRSAPWPPRHGGCTAW
jgi:hypothetical protein